MTRELNGFNHIAWVYDTLSSLVFGKSMTKAQTVFLPCVPPNAEVLILGGGSGSVLGELFRINPGCRICFIDASSAMIRLAIKNLPAPLHAQVEFIHGTALNIPRRAFDAIITSFFLDLFHVKSLEAELPRIHGALGREGLWLVSDFNDQGKWWQTLLLKVMYLFFKVTAGIEATRIPPWEKKLDDLKLDKRQTKMFFGNFIRCVLYRKVSE